MDEREEILKRELRKNEKKKESFEKLFESEEGKEVLSNLYRICAPSIGEYEPDPCKAAYNEGRRSVLAHILKLINIPKETFFYEEIKQYEEMKKEELAGNWERPIIIRKG